MGQIISHLLKLTKLYMRPIIQRFAMKLRKNFHIFLNNVSSI